MLPRTLQQTLESEHGLRVEHARSVGGGSINEAAWLETSDGPRFVKWNSAPPPGLFTAELDGLDALREAGAGVVPAVYGVSDGGDGVPGYLLLEAIETAPRADRAAQARRGEALAQLHALRADSFGHRIDNYIGTLPQPNARTATAAAFFATQRLAPQRRIAAARGTLDAGTLAALDRLCERLPDLVPERPACRIHGDLWSGNVLTRVDGAPVWIDPAAHDGVAEAELAFTTMFGGFDAAFYEAYETVAGSLVEGWRTRITLWNLYPLLVHANLFGGGYAREVSAAVARWV